MNVDLAERQVYTSVEDRENKQYYLVKVNIYTIVVLGLRDKPVT